MRTYVDTSALLKRYVFESQSDRFDEFVMTCGGDDELVISPLCLTEFVSALKRRERMGELVTAYVAKAWLALQREIHAGLWHVAALPSLTFSKACDDLLALPSQLTTLDALHLAAAELLNCQAFACADTRLCDAAQASGLHVQRFNAS
jgi:predicted nucleic acid-binding protein